MYRLHCFRRSTTRELRKHLIETLLFPIIDYCSLVYCDLSGEHDTTIQRVLNTGVRYVCGVDKWSHITSYRRRLGWLTAPGRRSYFAACLLYKIFATGTPAYLSEYFIANHSCRPVRGERPPLLVPSFRLESFRKSFHISSAYLWNDIPSNIRSAPSLPVFRKLIKDHYFASEGAWDGPALLVMLVDTLESSKLSWWL